MKRIKTLLAVLISLSIIFSAFTFISADTSDSEKNWEEQLINEWKSKGLFGDGMPYFFDPDGYIKESELLSLIANVFEYAELDIQDTETKDNIEKKDTSDEKDLSKENYVYRYKVAELLFKLLQLEKLEESTYIVFNDIHSLSESNVSYIYAMAEKGYLNGYENNKYKPFKPITYGEAIAVLDNIMGILIENTDIYGPEEGTENIEGNLTVNSPGTSLRNLVISGDLHLASGLTKEDITLDNVTVNGKIIEVLNQEGIAPLTFDDAYETDEDKWIKIDVAANDIIKDNVNYSIEIEDSSLYGRLYVYDKNTIYYIPLINFNGEDTFKYKLNSEDKSSDYATVSINVYPVNDKPFAYNDFIETNEDTSVTYDVIANDKDLEGDNLKLNSVTQPSNGTVVFHGNEITYTPNDNFNGYDSFTYEVIDGNGGKSTAIVTVFVIPVNDEPADTSDTATIDEDTSVSGTVVVSDVDLDFEGDIHTFSMLSNPSHGSVNLNGATGEWIYTPEANNNEDVTFTVEVKDSHGATAVSTISITINPVNDEPLDTSDTATIDEDTSASGTVIVSDIDLNFEGDIHTFSMLSTPSHGSVNLNGTTGEWTYTPEENNNENVTFTVLITDSDGETAVSTISVTINPVDDPPTAVDDNITINEDSRPRINVLGNDIEVDGDTKTIVSVTAPSNGKSKIIFHNGIRKIRYIPNSNWSGIDSFTYTMSDGISTSTATVTITVNPVNDAPKAVADSAEVDEDEDSSVNINVLSNDSDVENSPLTVYIANSWKPSHGTVTINPDQTVTYTPEPNYSGPDSFYYKANDGNKKSSKVKVTITVNSVIEPIIARDDYVYTTNLRVNIYRSFLLSNDSPIGVTFLRFDNPSNGTLTDNGRGFLEYSYNAPAPISDSFTYYITDGNVTTSATVYIDYPNQ